MKRKFYQVDLCRKEIVDIFNPGIPSHTLKGENKTIPRVCVPTTYNYRCYSETDIRIEDNVLIIKTKKEEGLFLDLFKSELNERLSYV